MEERIGRVRGLEEEKIIRIYDGITNSGSASIADYTRGSLTQLCGSSTFLGVVESAGSQQGKKARKAVSTRGGGGVGSSSRGVSVKGALAHAPPGPAADFPTGSSHRVLFFFFSPRKCSMKIIENPRKTPFESPISFIPSSPRNKPLSFIQNVMKLSLSLSLLVTRNKENTRRREKQIIQIVRFGRRVVRKLVVNRRGRVAIRFLMYSFSSSRQA